MTAELRDRLQASLGSAYALERELGGGGMSRVFVAQETALGRKVVVKVLPPELAASVSTERFKREIAVAARLQHPHIVPLLSAGEMDGIPYFTMPFIQGDSLRARLARQGELPVSGSVRILREIASALAHAHEHGVVHRDIKPDNVLFSGDVAMVADFGVAKALSASSNGDHGGVTSLGVALGTPAYMAPEQASADPGTDHRADIYAFGVLAYEVLSGQPPFVGRNPSQLLAAHVTEAPEPVGRRRPNLPPALSALVMRCLEKRPADRPQSAREIVHALDDLATPSGGMMPTSATLRAAEISGGAPIATGASGARTSLPGMRARMRMLVPALGAVVLGVATVYWTRGRADGRGVVATDARHARIAVLPFENLGDSADAYFADGMADAVRGKLTALPQLDVIARGSSVSYVGSAKPAREVAKELGVRYLLTGTVRWAKAPGGASRVQVSPELVEIGPDGAARSRWQQPFDAELADVFKVQGDIAARVVAAMRVAIGSQAQAQLARAPTTNPAAYDAFLRGQSAWNYGASNDAASLRRAVGYFERAVALDSNMLAGWEQLSRGYGLLYANTTASASVARQARVAAERAYSLDPRSAEGHRAMAMYYRLVEVDVTRALAEYEAALQVAPGDATTLISVASTKEALGRAEEALRDREAAQALDLRSPLVASGLTWNLLLQRRYPEARRAAERARALAPTSVNLVSDRVMIELGAGNLTEARRLIADAARDVAPDRIAAYMGTYWDMGWALDDAGQRRLLSLGPEAFDDDRSTWGIVRAQLYFWRGDTTQGRVWADTARVHFAEQLRDMPSDDQSQVFFGLSLAYLGQRAAAVAAGERGVALTPATRDAVSGSYFEHILARIYLLVGEREKALDILERLLSRPYYLSPGWLRIDPTFAELRGHPRFEKLIAAR